MLVNDYGKRGRQFEHAQITLHWKAGVERHIGHVRHQGAEHRAVSGDAALDQAGEALSGVFVDDRHQLDDPERAVTGLSTELNMPVDDLLAAPFLLVGSDDEILTAIRQRQQRWGINRLVIREDAIDKLAPLLPRLHETTE